MKKNINIYKPKQANIIKLKEYLKKKYNKPGAVYLGVTHRLDRPTSGAVIFTKTSKALSRMNTLFLNNNVEKIYWAIVKNKPEKHKDSLINWLKKNPKNKTKTKIVLVLLK